MTSSADRSHMYVMTDFNAGNAADGLAFEQATMTLLRAVGWKAVAGRVVDGRKVTVHGVDIDLVMSDQYGTVHTVECKGSLSGSSRPGAQRTDTVKKAVADAWLLSRYDDHLPHVLFASHLPDSGLAFDMLVEALAAGLFVLVSSPSGALQC